MSSRVLSRGALAAALVLTACSSPLDIPSDAKLDCSASACPAGWTCTPAKRCVPSGAVDVLPPNLSGTPAVSPPVARPGVDPRISFTVSEALSTDPIVHVDVGVPRTLTRVSGASPGLAYVYSYPRAGDEPQGRDCPITVDLTDSQGVTSTGLAAGALRFDDVPPSALAPAVTGSPAKQGSILKVTFRASEHLAADPVVRAGGLAFTKDPASSGLDYVFTRVSDGAEPQGSAGILATLQDDAGNTAEAGLGAAVFDRTAPALTAAPQVTPLAAAAGTLVRVSFTADKDLGADPAVTLGGLALEKGAQVGRTYTYARVANPSDGDGDRALSIGLVDLAGNASGPLAGPTVRFDFTPPAVSGLSICDDDGTGAACPAEQRTFSARPGHDRMKILFSLSEAPAAGADGLVVRVGGARLGTSGPDSCASAGGVAWRCAATVVDAAAGANPRVTSATVSIAAADAAGNAGSLLTFVTYDFQPPGLAGTPYLERCDGYAPARVGANDLWVKPVAATTGPGCPFTPCGLSAPIRVQASLDEAVTLGAAGLRLDDGTPLTLAACASSATQLVAVLASNGTAGNHAVLADVVDAAGNPRTLTLGTLRVDLAAPAAPDTVTGDRITFQRYPWGADATGGAKAFYLRGAAGAVTPGASVVAYDGPDPSTAAALGRTTADATGAFGAAPGTAGAFDVASGNAAEVFVSQEDPAGNRSPAALVWDAEWTATSRLRQPGSDTANRNRFTIEPAWRDSRDTPAQLEPADPSLAAAVSGAGISTAGEPDLVSRLAVPGLPPPRGYAAMEYDPDLGRSVVFGGSYSVHAAGTFWLSDTWSFDGSSWTQLFTPDAPAARSEHGLAYDQAHERFVLFGGTNGAGLFGDTWELSGSSWKRVCWPGCTAAQCSCTSMPSPRRGASTFYDPVNGKIVVAGGTDASGVRADTWSWDGRGWTPLAPATPVGAHSGALVAVSPELGQAMVLSPSSAQTWIWDGATWTAFADGGFATDLWWEPSDHTWRRFTTAGAVMFTWSGSAWTFVTSGFPAVGDVSSIASAPGGACGTFDRERGVHLRFGGCIDTGCLNPLQGTGWFTTQSFRALSAGTAPQARAGPALADFPPDGAAWLFGGNDGSRYAYADSWTFDGTTWRTDGVGTQGTGGITDPVLAYLGGGRLVHYGGLPTGGGIYQLLQLNTWVHTSPGWAWSHWSGSTWSIYPEPIATSDTPSQDDQSFAWDEAHDRGVFFRGNAGGSSTWLAHWVDNYNPWFMLGDTSGILWEAVATATEPSSARGHRMAYCPGVGGVVLFGGVTAGGAYLDETWTWSGTAWTLASPAVKPPARADHVLVCDRNRGRLYALGGRDGSGDRDDVWEWDGTTWRERQPASRPSARHGMAGAWTSALQRGVLFGGLGNGFQNDTWLLDGGRDRRPAQLLHASFAAADAGDAVLKGVAATFWSGGTGFAGGGVVNGVQLHVRDRGTWRPVGAANTAAPGAPAPVTWSTATDPEWTAPGAQARLRRLLAGDDLTVSFLVAPRGTNAALTPGAISATRYAEAVVRYRLACLPAGKPTTNAPRCCSGAVAGNVCQ